MKVLSVVGYTQSGKTTCIEKIIAELKKRNYSVASLKDIHFEEFKIDTDGTNTHRHKVAGSELVVARGINETDILYQESLDIYKILRFFDHDFVILEGVSEGNFPKIVAASNNEGIIDKLDDRVFLISGRIADEIEEFRGIKAISPMDDVEELVDNIEENVFDMLPNFDEKCCGMCGMSCQELCASILRNEKSRSDCILSDKNINLSINGKQITMVPFVQDILRNNVLAIVKELDGYENGHPVQINIGV